MFIELKRDENDLVIIQTDRHASFLVQKQRRRGNLWKTKEVMENVKKNYILIILDDCNAVVGEGQEGDEVGKYWLGVRNDIG